VQTVTDDQVKAAVKSAIQDHEVSQAITNTVKTAVETTLKTYSITGTVTGSVQAATKGDDRAWDPYRTTIHFLAGLLAFSATVIVGVLNAFPDAPIDTYGVTYRLLGGVLAWQSITALVAALAAAWIQIRKYQYRGESPKFPRPYERGAAMIIPALFGAMAAVYCVRAGSAMLNNDTELTGLASAICKIWPF
jgi:hypothetical protein